MYVEHPIFITPSDESAKVWRYFTLEGFLSMLSRQALFFVKASELEDHYEGTLPKFNELLAQSIFRPQLPSDYDFENFRRQVSESYNLFKQIILINSWYLDEFELVSMWRVRENGVLVESTFKHFRDSFRENQRDTVHIGTVKYMDFQTEWLPEGNLFEAFVTKRRQFQSEHEIRAVRMLPGSIVGLQPAPGQPTVPEERLDSSEILSKGKYVSVDLNELISRVHVAPLADDWIVPAIRSVLSKYGVNKPVEKSALYG
jgi:hypothetical protein